MEKEKKPNKCIEIPCNKKTFYRIWLSFLTPLHKFTPQVTMIAAELLRHRQLLTKKILDEEILTKTLLGPDIRNQILKDCNCTLSTFRVTMNKLKKAGFFVNGVINKRLIPNIIDENKFSLLICFNIDNSETNES